jgi:RNA polymerase sigma-70 factor, ECF subfamily
MNSAHILAFVPAGGDASARPRHGRAGIQNCAAMSDSEQLLVVRAQRGDPGAFGALVKKYRHRLARLLARFVRDPAEVEDLTQETFIRAYRALPRFRGDSAFYTWLHVIGVNTARNYLKARDQRLSSAIEIQADDAVEFEGGAQLRDIGTPESMALANEIAITLNDAIEQLPAELRTVILLRDLELLDYGHIARKLGCPIGTVRSRIFRAREAVAARLRPLLNTGAHRRW